MKVADNFDATNTVPSVCSSCIEYSVSVVTLNVFECGLTTVTQAPSSPKEVELLIVFCFENWLLDPAMNVADNFDATNTVPSVCSSCIEYSVSVVTLNVF